MLRNLITFAIGIPGLWLTILVFGWIVSGQIALLGLSVNREMKPWQFWLWILVFGTGCCAIFGAALLVFVGLI